MPDAACEIVSLFGRWGHETWPPEASADSFMRMNRLVLLPLALVASTAAAAGPPPAAATAANAFAVDLYLRLAAKPGNIVFSPLGISEAFAMTYAGARGETATEIARAM